MASRKMSERELERLFKPLANRRRLGILRILKSRREATVGELAEAIKLSFRSTSKHLGVLQSAGIVDREQRSTQVHYFIAKDIGTALKHILSLV